MSKARFYSFLLILFFLISILYLFPQFHINYPSLIDDTGDFSYVASHSASEIIFDGLFYDSRTWPLRLTIKKFFYEVGGINVGIHYFQYSLVLFFLLVIVFKLFEALKVKKIFAISATLLILFLPGLAENFYRLGTTEHFQVILLLLATYFFKRKYYFSLFLVFLSCFIKETSIFYLLFFLGHALLIEKNWKKFIVASLYFLSFAAIILFKQFTIGGDYISLFGFDSANILYFLRYNRYTLGLFLIAQIFSFISFNNNRKTLLSLGLISLVLVLPYAFWQMNSLYYQFPLQMYSYLLIILSISALYDKSIKLFHVSMLLSVFTIFFSIQTTIPVISFWHLKALDDSALFFVITSTDWSNYTVYSGLSGYEKMLKTYDVFINWSSAKKKPMSLYPQESDILSIPFTNNNMLNEITKSSIEKYKNDINPNKILLKEGYQRKRNKENMVCSSSVLIQESCKYYFVSPIKPVFINELK